MLIFAAAHVGAAANTAGAIALACSSTALTLAVTHAADIETIVDDIVAVIIQPVAHIDRVTCSIATNEPPT
jgi:hypothetical protein